MNRVPLAERQIYPDARGDPASPHALALYYLQVGEAFPAKDEYEDLFNIPQVLASLTAIDSLLMEGRPVPKRRWETFTHNGIRLFEIKAPQNGKRISRLLAYRENGWRMFLAFAKEKKSNQLPSAWKQTASERVKRALSEGDLL